MESLETIDEAVNSFTKEWWHDFHGKTCGLTKPNIFKNVLSSQDIEMFIETVKAVLTDVSKRKVKKGFRLSVEGEMKDENLKLIHNNVPEKDEDVVQWSSRTFEDKKFGIILNSCQNYSLKLKQEITKRFTPLLKEFGLPPNGLEITLFIGNYGYTPLGFHVDPAGHKVTHLHLGPGSKEMYLMAPEKFKEELGERAGSKNFDKLIPESEKFEFSQGDLFFMPIDTYHVGNTPELSVGLTIWHIEPSVSEFQAKLSIELMKKIFLKEDHKTLIRADLNPVGDVSGITMNLSEVMDIEEGYEDMTLSESVNSLLLEHRYKLFSNGYFYGFLQDQEAPKEKIRLTLKQRIRGVNPFKIYYLNHGDISAFYVQGKKIPVPSNIDHRFITERLNSYQSYEIEGIFQTMKEYWEDDLILHVASEIYKAGGVTLEE